MAAMMDKRVAKYIQIPSEEAYFNTAQRPIDDFIREELEMARETRREQSRLIEFAASE